MDFSHERGTLVGRDRELQRFDQLVLRSAAGVPQFVAVEGPSGIGKTTLLNAMLKRLDGWRILPLELDPEDVGAPAVTLRRVLSALGAPALPAEAGVAEMVQAVLEAVYAVDGQTCLLIEDAHWLDEASGEVLWRSARELMSGRSMVIVSYRPNQNTFAARVERFLASGRMGEHFILGPLSEEDVRGYLAARLTIPVSGEVARSVHAATGGTPLLVETIADALVSAPVGHRQLSSALSELTRSGDNRRRIFDDALLSTLQSLGPRQREVVELLAVAGQPLPEATLHSVLAQSSQATPELAALRRSHLVLTSRQDATLSVSHPLLATLIAEQVPAERRAQMHRQLGQWGPATQRLGHRVQALALEPEATAIEELVAELMQTGVAALQAHQGELAFTAFRWALGFTPQPQVLALAVRSAVLANKPELLNSIQSVLHASEPSPARSAALALIRLNDNELPGAVEELSRGLALDVEDPEGTGTILIAHALVAVGRIAYAGAQFALAAATIDVGLQRLQLLRAQLEDQQESVPESYPLLVEARSLEALLNLWIGLRHGDPSRLVDYVAAMQQQLQVLSATPGAEVARDVIAGVIGSTQRQLGMAGEAHALIAPSYERRLAGRAFDIHTGMQMGLLYFQAGYWDEAQAVLSRVVEDCLFLPEELGVRLAHGAAAIIPLARGERVEGMSLLSRARSEEGDFPSAVTASSHHYALGLEAAFRDEHDDVVRQLLPLCESPVGWPFTGHTQMVFLARSLAVKHAGHQISEMEAALNELFPTERPPMYGYTEQALKGHHAAAEGKVLQAFAHLQQALSIVDAQPGWRPAVSSRPGGAHALDRAFLALDLARMIGNHLHELGEHTGEGAELAEQAADFFLRVGVPTLQSRARELSSMLRHADELKDPAAPPVELADGEDSALRAAAYQRLGQLTTRERQIALEVAEGQSNREIASSLFVSVRTVEYHVANALSKLDMGGRGELRRALKPVVHLEKAARGGD